MLGSTIGNSIVPGVGGAIGGILGGGLGYLYKSVTGSGNYTIKENTLLKNTPIPSFGPSCIRIRHKEYIGDIVSSSSANTFNIDTFALNPGVYNTFPWLSAIALNYEEYKFNGLIFEFVSTSANALNSTNTALGKTIMATDYNAANSSFTSIEEMMVTEFSNFAKPAESIIHAIECSAEQRPTFLSYIRSGTLPSNLDIKTYDLGNFQIATSGLQGTNVNIGSLWVTYDVTLCKPYLNTATFNFADHYVGPSPTTSSLYFGATTALQPGSNLGSSLSSGTTINFPAAALGYYMIIYVVKGSSVSTTAPTVTPTNCTLLTCWVNDTATTVSTGSTTTNELILCFYVSVSGANSYVVLSGATFPTSATFMDLWVIRMSENLIT